MDVLWSIFYLLELKVVKILYADIQYCYGNPKIGINYISSLGFLKGFTSLGFEVECFYYDSLLHERDVLNKSLIQKAEEYKPDLIFFCIFSDHFTKETLLYLKSKYKTVNWFGDDTWRFDSFTTKYALLFSFCITTSKFCVEKYHQLGQTNVILSQWAALDKNPIGTIEHDYIYDISFVGAYSYYREWFISVLKKSGLSINVFGNGWNNSYLTDEEMADVFKRTKINLNISNSEIYDFSYLFSRPVFLIKKFIKYMFLKNKIKSLDIKFTEQIKARNFEIPYYGGFQLTNYVSEIEDYLTIGKEVICYANVHEAIDQIKYYLNNESKRREIQFAGHKRVINNHMYYYRFKEILLKIN